MCSSIHIEEKTPVNFLCPRLLRSCRPPFRNNADRVAQTSLFQRSSARRGGRQVRTWSAIRQNNNVSCRYLIVVDAGVPAGWGPCRLVHAPPPAVHPPSTHTAARPATGELRCTRSHYTVDTHCWENGRFEREPSSRLVYRTDHLEEGKFGLCGVSSYGVD